jgi:hypothetical protein
MNVELEGIAFLRKLVQQGLAALPSGDPARTRLEETIKWTSLVDGIYQKALAQWRTITQ